MKTLLKPRKALLALALAPALMLSCGAPNQSPKAVSQPPGPIEQMFTKAAVTHQIPVRYLLAVAYLESRINPNPASAIYQTDDNRKGISLGETAFGLPYKKLEIPADAASRSLEVQLNAYARALNKHLALKQIALPISELSNEDKFNWLWQIANFHRGGMTSRRNVQITFLKELLDVLNHGFSWQDQATSEIVTLGPEDPVLNVEDFPEHVRKSLTLYTGNGEIYVAKFFELSYQAPNDWRNKPDHIIITHCPFSVSACLEMQGNKEEQDGVRLGAHYVIPQDDSIIQGPIQVARHNQVVYLTNNEGIPETIQDAIVIMLTGNSGRYVESSRIQADPTWFTKWQLRNMGDVVRNVCHMISGTSEIDLPEEFKVNCMDPSKKKGVRFRHQGASQQFHWGDIADYDENIFWPYIYDSEALKEEVTLSIPGGSNVFPASAEIPFKLNYMAGAALINFEQAKICPGQRLIWTTVQSKRVYNSTSTVLKKIFWDHGPNNNGEHFLRVLVFNNKNTLMGWTIQNIILTDYFTDNVPTASDKECNRNGS